MIDTKKLHLGATVTLRQNFGKGPICTAIISGFGEVKGRKVVDYEDGKHWAYLEQVDSIVPKVSQLRA